MPGLSGARIDHYSQHGFVALPEILDGGEVERYRVRAREIALGNVPQAAKKRLVRDIDYARGSAPIPKDSEQALWKILNPDGFDPMLTKCLALPRVLSAAECLIGEDILAFLMMFIDQPPGLPQSVLSFFQDAFFPVRVPAHMRGSLDTSESCIEKMVL